MKDGIDQYVTVQPHRSQDQRVEGNQQRLRSMVANI